MSECDAIPVSFTIVKYLQPLQFHPENETFVTAGFF